MKSRCQRFNHAAKHDPAVYTPMNQHRGESGPRCLCDTCIRPSPATVRAYNHLMRFTCQPGCTRCCTQKGWVYLSLEDVPRLAAFLGITQDELQRQHLYSTKNTRRLRMRAGQCPFLNAGGCSVHPAKPTQCRLFPFWPELIEDKQELKATAQWCPGIGKGNLIPVSVLTASAQEMRSAYPNSY